MKNSTRTVVLIFTAIIVVAVAILLMVFLRKPKHAKVGPSMPTSLPTESMTPTATVSYSCDAGKTINASFYAGAPETVPPNPNQPPTPTGTVKIVLSDGRSMTLNQTISADGARYSNADGSFTFWSKGNGAVVLENNQDQTYMGCNQVAPQPAGSDLTQVYSNGAEGFSIRIPAGYTTDENYKYQALGPGKDIEGTKFTIAPSVAAGTNLSTDSYIGVEEIPKAATCGASLFLEKGAKTTQVTENGTTYSVGTSADAGAGNRYDETVYAIPGTSPCVAVRYFIHYGAFDNFPAGSIKQFDEAGLKSEFDLIRSTLVLNLPQ